MPPGGFEDVVVVDEGGGDTGCLDVFVVFYFFLDFVVDVVAAFLIVAAVVVMMDVGGMVKVGGSRRVDVMRRGGVSIDGGGLNGLRNVKSGIGG